MKSTRNVEVLLVDDSAADIELTLHVLRHNNLSNAVYVAEDGPEALDFIFGKSGVIYSQDDRPRLILLDLNLPKMDGIKVLEAIRADARTRTIPVVILTSSKEERDLLRGYECGANAFIQKPVDFLEFQNAVKAIGLFWLMMNEPPPFRMRGMLHSNLIE